MYITLNLVTQLWLRNPTLVIPNSWVNPTLIKPNSGYITQLWFRNLHWSFEKQDSASSCSVNNAPMGFIAYFEGHAPSVLVRSTPELCKLEECINL